MKKLRIVNKKKFIRSVSILLLIILLIIIFGTHRSYSSNNINYKKQYIVSGDTLWEIAQHQLENNEYFKGMEITEVINEIEKFNEMSDSRLIEGEILLIPII